MATAAELAAAPPHTMAEPTPDLKSPPSPPSTATTPPPGGITLRAPSPSTTPSSPTISAPPLSFLSGAWHVTHSTLPMWRKARNVVITYTPMPATGSAGGRGLTSGTHIADVVTYQPLDKGSAKVSTIKGVDKPFLTAERRGSVSDTAPPATTEAGDEVASLGYEWRGKGWLMIATSRWEILGWGVEEGGNGWVVTYFAKTMFTPAGVDFYSRGGRLREGTLRGIKEAVSALGGDVAKLGRELFEVAFDGK